MGLLRYGAGLGAALDTYLNLSRYDDEKRRQDEQLKLKQQWQQAQMEEQQRQAVMQELQRQTLMQTMKIAAEQEKTRVGEQQKLEALRGELANASAPQAAVPFNAAMRDYRGGLLAGATRMPTQEESLAKKNAAFTALYPKEGLKMENEAAMKTAALEATQSNFKDKLDNAIKMLEFKGDLQSQQQADKLQYMYDALYVKAAKGDKAPAGYRYTPDGNLEPITGGPADYKREQAYIKDTSTRDSMFDELTRLGAQAKSLMDHPGLSMATGVAGKFPNIPGSNAANFDAQLGTLKSQTAFSVLQNMRNNSKTGGALGQVSDKEGQLLQDNLGALDKAQSSKAYKESLKKIVDYTEQAKGRIQKAYDMQWGEKQPETNSKRRFTIIKVR